MRSSEHIVETHLEKLKKTFKVFQGEYKIQNYKTHYFMIFEIFSQVSISIFIAALQPWPLAQTILILISNILFLIATIIIRPYTGLRLFFQSCVL